MCICYKYTRIHNNLQEYTQINMNTQEFTQIHNNSQEYKEWEYNNDAQDNTIMNIMHKDRHENIRRHMNKH